MPKTAFPIWAQALTETRRWAMEDRLHCYEGRGGQSCRGEAVALCWQRSQDCRNV